MGCSANGRICPVVLDLFRTNHERNTAENAACEAMGAEDGLSRAQRYVRVRHELPLTDKPVEYSTGCTFVTGVGEVAEASRRCETYCYLNLRFNSPSKR